MPTTSLLAHPDLKTQGYLYRIQKGKKKWKMFEVTSPCVQVTSLVPFTMILLC